jgi:hypothetical protein
LSATRMTAPNRCKGKCPPTVVTDPTGWLSAPRDGRDRGRRRCGMARPEPGSRPLLLCCRDRDRRQAAAHDRQDDSGEQKVLVTLHDVVPSFPRAVPRPGADPSRAPTAPRHRGGCPSRSRTRASAEH